MADAIRTKADALSRIPVGVSEGTSVQDLRDYMLSLSSMMGQISNQGNAVETVIADPSEWVEGNMNGSVLSEVSQTLVGTDDFDMPATGQLRYLLATQRHFHCMATVSFLAASNNQEIHFRLAKSGTHSPQCEVRRKVGTGTDVGALAIHWITPLTQNQYLSLFVQNITSNANITIVSSNIQAMGMIM